MLRAELFIVIKTEKPRCSSAVECISKLGMAYCAAMTVNDLQPHRAIQMYLTNIVE